MPKRKSKKFIEKKNSVTFHLVHRSQKDPLTADETAPQRVLVPVADIQNSKHEKSRDSTKDRKEEQQKYGIFFDDDYDYLKHLKDVKVLSEEWERIDISNTDKDYFLVNDKSRINLPSSVFESNVQEKIGLLNKAAPISGPQLDLDPDVIAALDDNYDFNNPDNQLEDNFIELANVKDFDNSELFDDEKYISDEEKDEVLSLTSKYTFRNEETKSRFTEYSISSSVIKRNNQLTFLDDKFETMYTSYNDNEIGPLDCEEIEGYIEMNSPAVLQYAEEYEKQLKDTENITKCIEKQVKIVDNDYSSSEDTDNSDVQKLIVEIREKNKWDCESILSTYSNVYNHPKLIAEPKQPVRIQIDSKTGIPKNFLNARNQSKLTTQNLIKFQNTSSNSNGSYKNLSSVKSVTSILSVRARNETPEEKKERKKAVKNYRKDRRKERKANVEAFKEEKKRQEKVLVNERNNIQGNKIL